MQRTWLGIRILALCGLALPATAQVEVSWSLVHNRTVLMEPVRAVVKIANHSGQTLDLTPRGNARLSFDVEDRPTSTVADTGHPLVRQGVIIPSGDTREVEVNLLDAYRIIRGQSYMLTPVLEFAGLRFLGPRLSLEVQPGLELLKRDFGLPANGNAREVSLRLIHRDRSDRLFFRLDDPATGFCLGVYELGRVIRFFAPRLEQDGAARFHVLHQSGPDRFAHSIFSNNGAPQGVTFYAASVGSVRLDRVETGEVQVSGATPYEEDPGNPGMLIAPVLPPAHPFQTTLGEPSKSNSRPARQNFPAAKSNSRAQPAGTKTDAGSEPVSW